MDKMIQKYLNAAADANLPLKRVIDDLADCGISAVEAGKLLAQWVKS